MSTHVADGPHPETHCVSCGIALLVEEFAHGDLRCDTCDPRRDTDATRECSTCGREAHHARVRRGFCCSD
ncbi:hypothetical protein [Halomarina oriensis]|uniref:Uncharacterized protein n=1 Tax=Halomarina oriensis TaxID=671145 RepID=A0A6B0GSY8_9EURY|nr:hypothetical protein [Halomarina oriensis]MWG34808.1 hypothetical protein [Halomarina oriensis]